MTRYSRASAQTLLCLCSAVIVLVMIAATKPEKEHVELISREALQLCTEHLGWSFDDCTLITQKDIHVGMSRDQVVAAWGIPPHITLVLNDPPYLWEVWFYNDTNLVFRDGILVIHVRTVI